MLYVSRGSWEAGHVPCATCNGQVCLGPWGLPSDGTPRRPSLSRLGPQAVLRGSHLPLQRLPGWRCLAPPGCPKDLFQPLVFRSDSIYGGPRCFTNTEILNSYHWHGIVELLEFRKILCSQRTHSLAGDTKPTDGKQLVSTGA